MGKLVFILICFGLLAAGCGGREDSGKEIFQIYYVSNSETKVEMHTHEMESEEPEGYLEELVACLSQEPEKLEYKPPLAMGFQVLSMKLEDSKLQIDVDAAYKNLPVTTEVLVRAALVRTLTQLPEISFVMITVEGNQLYDNNGSTVGLMSADQFIDNDGNEINTYELARVRLYFAGESGSELISTYREKHYSTNTSLERLVVEELIAGPDPMSENLYPSINPSTKIINVMTTDGVCYVNLDDSFLTVVNNVSTDVSVYSIVNSLAELSNINKVQILINGEVPSSFSSAVFERNLDIVTTIEK